MAGKSDTSHLHDGRYYTESETDTLLGGKSNTSHGHVISDVINLQTSLNNKSDVSHTHALYMPNCAPRVLSSEQYLYDVNSSNLEMHKLF